jgi:hypothetical protein
MADELVGSVSWPVFIGLTLIGFGWVGYMSATALARTWRPWWQVVVYGVFLGVANRLMEMMLFEGYLLSGLGYLVGTAYLIAIMLISYRIALSAMMISQYPWLYERTGLFSWRERPAGG